MMKQDEYIRPVRKLLFLVRETPPAPPQEGNHPAYGGRKIPLQWRGARRAGWFPNKSI